MAGAPITNVCSVLREIHKETNIDTSVLLFGTRCDKTNLSSLQHGDWQANQGTSFPCIFDGMKRELLANPVSTSFIFLTDGQDGSSQTQLNNAITSFKLVVRALSKCKVVINVIGFGDVSDSFLSMIKTLGNQDGCFQYSTQGGELQKNFKDIFQLANTAEHTVTLGGKSYTAPLVDGKLRFLVPSVR